MKPNHLIAAGILGLTAAVAAMPVSAAELIQNGGFEADGMETDAPAGWQIATQGMVGNIVVTDAVESPISAYATVGASQGSFYALLDAAAPSNNALYQSFTTAAVTQATLSFQLFVNDQGAGVPYIDGSGLDFTTGDEYRANQHVRVDILAADASPFDTGAGVLRTFYLGGPNGREFVNGYSDFSFDVTDLLASGGEFQLRFASVGNQAALQFGVDAVSLDVTAVPEPEHLRASYSVSGSPHSR
ncbi:MAG: hypothetical protein KIT73_06255 [Burkholderiales bacterium]|nr:hypothetical protein [Burkholderiales bacterium]